jgi:hypothetical protein
MNFKSTFQFFLYMTLLYLSFAIAGAIILFLWRLVF